MADSAQASHPRAAQLAAFAQSKLAGPQREALQAHLKACPSCRQALAALPGGAESLSGEDTQGTVGAAAPPPGATATHHPAGDVPADLANHPKFEVLQLLGQGGMGAVYKARHKKMDRLVALKVINAKLLDNPKAVARFQQEVKAAAKLDHPNIVRAFDADEAGGTHFLVMEFVEGTDLAKYVEKKGPLPVAHACHFVRQAALGLQHAHQHGMVHRDIKPHNLMLASPAAPAPGAAPGAPVVKVMDFGLARLAREQATESGLTGENALMGTADYIAPEQAEDAHRADIRADIYSLGCTLYHLLAGRPMLAGASVTQKLAAHLTGKLPLAELPAGVPAELRAVLAKMVAKDPAQRYQTPGEVAAALVPFIKKATTAPLSPVLRGEGRTERTVAEAEAPAAKRARKRKRKRRGPIPVVIGVAVLALLLAGSVGWLASRRGRAPTTPPAEPGAQTPGTGVTAPPVARPPEKLPPTYKNSLDMEFVLVPKGKSWLGGGGTPGDREVEIKEDFYLGKYEVTQGEWGKVLGSRPSCFGRAGDGAEAVKAIADEELRQFPVERVSWDDAQLFLAELNKRDKVEGWTYRLPKEVEWEYACRGGPMADRLESTFDYYFEKPTDQLLPAQANFEHGEKSLKRPCKVGSYKPNKLGLYDMHGNVWEWCEDLFPQDNKDPQAASQRVVRGGSWYLSSGDCRAANRSAHAPSGRYYDLGLRLARVPVGKESK